MRGASRAGAWAPRVLGGVCLVVLVTFAARFWHADDGADASSLQPARSFGPAGARFVVSFGAAARARDLSTESRPNHYLENMTARRSLYEAKLGPDAYESVQALSYERPLTKGNIHWWLYYYDRNYHVVRWRGLPAATLDVACRVGDSTQSCPGRVAGLDVIDGATIYELSASGASEAEVRRFFDSFRPVGT